MLALLVALFLTVIGAEESLAQGQAPAAKSDLEQQYDQAFQAMFEDPANLDKAFAYARLAIQMLGFEGAISTLERMLIINADLPRVRMELGVLYYRLRSYEVAKGYLEEVLAEDDLPPVVASRAEEFLARIE